MMPGRETSVVKGSRDRIVADGRDRLRREEWYRKQKREVREAIRRKYEADMAAASSFRRIVVYWRMQRELRRELEALAPERSSYLRT
jgi:hypothetical protein